MVWLALLSCASSTAVPTVRAERGDLTVELTFKGELEARESAEIVNPIEGWSEIEFLAEEGERVKEGDVLVKFTTEKLEKNRVEAAARLEVAKTKVEQARARLALQLGEARARIVQAQLDEELAEFRQTDSLTVPRVEREESKIAALRAGLTTSSAATQLTKIELDAGTEIQLLEIEAIVAERKIGKLDVLIAKSSLNAPQDGLVLVQKRWGREKFRVGHDVYQGSTLIELPDTSRVDVIAWVHEIDSPSVAVGQKASLTMDAHPDFEMSATITEVAPLVVPRGEHGVRQLRVVLEPDETTPEMKPGMTTGVSLVTGAIEAGVLIPIEAVFTGSSGPYVIPTGSGQPVSVDVLGEDAESAAVSGLEEGTEVFGFDPEAWARGERPFAEAE